MLQHHADESDPDVREVVKHELSLLKPDVRGSPDAVLGLLHEEFREFGASGRTWDRSAVAAALAADPGNGAEAQDMRAVRVAADVVLLTYLAWTPEGVSLRSSLWVRDGERWWLFFHQGTTRP